jgi:hypothetical protein
VIEILDDISIDIPAVHKFLGIYLGRLIAVESTFTFTSLLTLLKAQINTKAKIPNTPQIIAAAFKVIKEIGGESLVCELYERENVDLSLFWPVDKRSDTIVSDWMQANDLLCLNPSLQLVSGLKTKLGSQTADEIIAWIEVRYY